MADEKSYEEKVAEDLAKQYEDEGKEVDEAVDASREDVEEYYEEQRKAEDAREKELRDYQLGKQVDAVGNPTSGPAVALQSAAGPVEEVAAERQSEANEDSNEESKAPASKAKSTTKKAS